MISENALSISISSNWIFIFGKHNLNLDTKKLTYWNKQKCRKHHKTALHTSESFKLLAVYRGVLIYMYYTIFSKDRVLREVAFLKQTTLNGFSNKLFFNLQGFYYLIPLYYYVTLCLSDKIAAITSYSGVRQISIFNRLTVG